VTAIAHKRARIQPLPVALVQRAVAKTVARLRNGAGAPSSFFILDSQYSSDLAEHARRQFASGTDYILIPNRPIDRRYAATLVSRAEQWLAGRSRVLFDPSHFFDARDWSLPILTPQLLAPVTIYSLRDRFSLASICALDCTKTKGNELPYVHPDLDDIYEIAYKHADYYSYVGILVSDDCNMSCTMCPFHSQDDSYSFRGDRMADRIKKTVSAEDFRRFIDTLPPGKLILFSSAGELFQTKSAMDYIEYARERGHPVVVGTNGSYINERIGKQLIDMKISSVTFSVDAYTEEGYEKVRVGGKWDLLLRNIDTLVKLRDELGSPMSITANCVLFDELKPKKAELLEFWSRRVDYINLMTERVDYFGRFRPGTEFVPPPSMERPLCFVPFEAPTLLSNGDISPCCQISIGEWFERIDWLSNIKTSTVDEAHQRYRTMMLDPESALRKFCTKCSYWPVGYCKDGKSPLNEGVGFDRQRKVAAEEQ
jgi:MoaA/NifB/PqqE/SkfB family radical SAM enzyme